MFDHVQHNMDDMKTDVFFVKSKCSKNGKTRDSGNKKFLGREYPQWYHYLLSKMEEKKRVENI